MALTRSLKMLVPWLAFLGAGLMLGLAGTYLYLDPQVPRAESYRTLRLQTPLRIFSADGAFMGEFGERHPPAPGGLPGAFREGRPRYGGQALLSPSRH